MHHRVARAQRVAGPYGKVLARLKKSGAGLQSDAASIRFAKAGATILLGQHRVRDGEGLRKRNSEEIRVRAAQV